jgi:uncharacterized membrane-anchored protein
MNQLKNMKNLKVGTTWQLAVAVLGFVIFSAVVALALPNSARAQDNPVLKQLESLNWQSTTAPGNIAGKATVNLDGNLRYLDDKNTSEFLKLTGNLPQANMYTVATKNMSWFSVFKFVDEGYVKDDEKIDADALLATLKENNKNSAEERKKRGLPGLFLEGWFIAPRYDADTRRLEWATLLKSDSGDKLVNFSTKILGRAGHMDVILVSDPQNLESDIKEFKAVLKGFDYVPGERYSEWKQGEKIAAYGLGALVLGGAAAIATKKGFWAVLVGVFAAGWKLIAGLVVAGLAGLGSIFKKKQR